jgi:hypothetical protein
LVAERFKIYAQFFVQIFEQNYPTHQNNVYAKRKHEGCVDTFIAWVGVLAPLIYEDLTFDSKIGEKI